MLLNDTFLDVFLNKLFLKENFFFVALFLNYDVSLVRIFRVSFKLTYESY